MNQTGPSSPPSFGPWVLLAAIGLASGAHAQLVITEVCSRNATVWEAPDGDHPDWIEVYNSGPTPVELEHYFLSDKIIEPGMWRLPDEMLEPGVYRLLFSDNESGFPFGIDGEGETIVLSDEDLNVLQTMDVPRLDADHSFGSGAIPGSGPYFFDLPTPGAANTSTTYLGYAPTPAFILPAGYTNAGATVNIAADAGEVRWTSNGRVPDASAALANGGIPINTTTVLLARRWLDQYLPSQVAVASYVVNDQRELPIVSLAVDPDSMFHEEYGMYMTGPDADSLWPYYGANYWADRSLPAYVEFFETDGTRGLVQQVDVQIHGGRRSRTNPQRPLRLTAQGKYGDDVMNYPFFPEREGIDRFRTLVLRNSGGDFCLSNFRDGLFHEISLHNNLDVDELAFRPAIAYVNGEYWGLIEIRERIDEHHLHYNYGADLDDALMMEEENWSMQGDTIHFWNLMQFIYTQDLNDPANWAHVDSLLDLHSAKDYFALEMHAGNVDWPSNNLKYWKPSITEGKWRYILYDLDATMQLYGWIPEDLDMFYWTFVHRAGFVHSELFRGLMTNNEFKRGFLNRLADLMNTALRGDHFQAEVDKITVAYASEIERHFDRWDCWLPAYQDHAFNIIPHFARARCAYVRQHVLDYYSFPSAPLLEFEVFPPAAGSLRINTIAPEPPFSGYYFNGNDIDVTVEPNEGYVFDHWGYSGDETTTSDLHWKRSFPSDGKVVAHFRSATGAIIAYPNPTTGELSLGIDASGSSQVMITVTDLAQRAVARHSALVTAGITRISIDLSSLPAGVYLLTSDADGARNTVKVLKQ